MTLTRIPEHSQTTEALEWLSNYQLNPTGVLGKPRISQLELGDLQPLDLSLAMFEISSLDACV